jgi:hypothetical protein
MHRGSDEMEEEEDEDDDIRDEANRGFLAHAHGSLLTSSLSGGCGLESASSSSGAGGKVIVHLGACVWIRECGHFCLLDTKRLSKFL